MKQDVFLYITSAIYNVGIVWMIFKINKSTNLKHVLREKVLHPRVPDVAPAQNGAGANPQSASQQAASEAPGDSYSRVAGLVGAAVLSCFIWAVGNVTIYNAYMNPAEAKNTLTGVGTFILSASALFAPYAFNQLSTVYADNNRNR